MRELSRIFKGIVQVDKKTINECSAVQGDKKINPSVFLVGLWRHECERVFADKMIT
jgi:dynein heavy chain